MGAFQYLYDFLSSISTIKKIFQKYMIKPRAKSRIYSFAIIAISVIRWVFVVWITLGGIVSFRYCKEGKTIDTIESQPNVHVIFYFNTKKRVSITTTSFKSRVSLFPFWHSWWFFPCFFLYSLSLCYIWAVGSPAVRFIDVFSFPMIRGSIQLF